MKLGDDVFVGNRLKKTRERTSLTQEQVAVFLGVTTEYIAMIEEGEKSISGDRLLHLANLYGKEPEYFINEDIVEDINGYILRGDVTTAVLKTIESISEIGHNYALFKRLSRTEVAS